MKNTNKLLIIFLLCITPIYGQTEKTNRKNAQSLLQCYQSALKQSEQIAIEKEALSQANERYTQSKANMLPNLSASYQYQKQEDLHSENGSAFYPNEQHTTKLTLNQPLFQGFRNISALRQKQNLTNAERHLLEQAKTQLFNEVTTAFYNVLSLEQEKENYTNEIQANQRRVNELINLQRKGNIREADTLSTQTTVTTLEAELEGIKGKLNAARETLSHLTGMDINTPLEDKNENPKMLSKLDIFLKKINERHDILAAQEEIKATEEELKIAKGKHLPSIDLNGNYYFDRAGLLKDVNWDAGISIKLPLFEGGAINSQVKEVLSKRNTKQLLYTQTKRNAENIIRSVYAITEADLDQIEKLKQALKIAKQNYDVQLREYQAGLARNIDILQASSTKLATKRGLDKAIYNLKIDFAKLQSESTVWPDELEKGR